MPDAVEADDPRAGHLHKEWVSVQFLPSRKGWTALFVVDGDGDSGEVRRIQVAGWLLEHCVCCPRQPYTRVVAGICEKGEVVPVDEYGWGRLSEVYGPDEDQPGDEELLAFERAMRDLAVKPSRIAAGPV